MKLMEAPTVTVIRENQVDYIHEDTVRECGVEIRLTEACTNTPDNVALIGTNSSAPGAYKSVAFPLDGYLRRNNFCRKPDDIAWFAKAWPFKLDFILSWMFTIEHAAGSESWTGDDNVQSVSLAATPSTEQRAAAIVAARDLWEQTVFATSGPTLHIPVGLAPAFKATGLLDSKNETIWGDPVVMGSGYSKHPNAFWSGPIEIHLGKLNEESVPKTRTNDNVLAMDQWARFDVPPCTIVRIGAYA